MSSVLTLSQTTHFKIYKLKEFADDYFKILMEMVENYPNG